MVGNSEKASEVKGGRELRQLFAGSRGVTKLASPRSHAWNLWHTWKIEGFHANLNREERDRKSVV